MDSRCVAGCSGSYGLAPNQLYNPQSMSFDSDGNIWVADTDNRRVQKFLLRPNPDGEQHSVIWVKNRYTDTRWNKVSVSELLSTAWASENFI